MDPEIFKKRLLEVVQGCNTIPAIVMRFKEHGVVFRPNPLEALFGRGVTAATPELLLALDDGEVFLRDMHGRNCMLVVRRTGDTTYLQGEYTEPGSDAAA